MLLYYRRQQLIGPISRVRAYPHLHPVTATCSWKLVFASNCAEGRGARDADCLKSVLKVSYFSENYRLSHTDAGVLRVYKRVSSPARPAVVATAAAEDDTGHAPAVLFGGAAKARRVFAMAARRAIRK